MCVSKRTINRIRTWTTKKFYWPYACFILLSCVHVRLRWACYKWIHHKKNIFTLSLSPFDTYVFEVNNTKKNINTNNKAIVMTKCLTDLNRAKMLREKCMFSQFFWLISTLRVCYVWVCFCCYSCLLICLLVVCIFSRDCSLSLSQSSKYWWPYWEYKMYNIIHTNDGIKFKSFDDVDDVHTLKFVIPTSIPHQRFFFSRSIFWWEQKNFVKYLLLFLPFGET